MENIRSIITIGLCPCWDITCSAAALDWGSHSKLDSQDIAVAGKAFNISRALAWLGRKNTAAGLWGKSDYQQMTGSTADLKDFVDIKFTPAPGATRLNITAIDTKNDREMHLRAESKLATPQTLAELDSDLSKMVDKNSICIFAGSMPDGQLLDGTIAIIKKCKDKGAKIAVDTSGAALERLVSAGGLWLIKPNVAELAELLGEQVDDDTAAIVKAARPLCDKSEIVIVSRGPKGAVAVTKDTAIQARLAEAPGKVVNTVACGDYLLAGFIDGFCKEADLSAALNKAIKTATARAFGQTKTTPWPKAVKEIKTNINMV